MPNFPGNHLCSKHQDFAWNYVIIKSQKCFWIHSGVFGIRDLGVLTVSLAYIEDNIKNEILQEDIASACFCSLSHLQKLLRYVFHISVGDYITRRRMTLAARDLLAGASVLDTAMNYQYNSPEVFSRAFAKVWNTTPSNFKHTRKFTDIFPKLTLNTEGDCNMSNLSRRKFDMTELYDYIRAKEGKYVLCFDVAGLLAVNIQKGRAAGDKVIAECLRRIDEQCDDSMLLCRIGGDEFALFTDFTEEKAVEDFAAKILAQNGKTVPNGTDNIPVWMRAGAMKLAQKTKYGELFTRLSEEVCRASEDIGKCGFVKS